MRTKFLFVAILASLSMSIHAQTNNFSATEDGKLIWQKVFETDMTFDSILENVVNDGVFFDIMQRDGVITCRLNRYAPNYTEIGYKRGTLAIYVVCNDIDAFVTIQVKEGRYRVTLENINLIENTTGGVFQEGTSKKIETWAIRDGELTGGFCGKPSEAFNKAFTQKFTIQAKPYINDEW